jgi:tetratricopeptide (TPR) repeat protein
MTKGRDTRADDPESLFEDGESFMDSEQYPEALRRFRAAWDALAEPKGEQGRAIQILAAIADCHFYTGNWEECHNVMQQALRCGADIGNPFVRLRLGQSLYELGNEQEAANWLVPVYLMNGRAPFEDDDPKYLEFFRDKLRPPEGGWPEGW